MKAVIVLCSLWAISFAENDGVCYDSLLSPCAPESDSSVIGQLANCNASYGGAQFLMDHLSNYANSHISVSFDYLLLASNFGSYVRDRKGFEKLFRHLSDSTWEDGIDLIKYISKRGGTMDFKRKFNDNAYERPSALLNEIQGLARALDTHKNLATMAFDLHQRASESTNQEPEVQSSSESANGDPEVASYLEDKFLHKHADIIRSLAGHISDVEKMISRPDQKSVSLFIFDEYLRHH